MLGCAAPAEEGRGEVEVEGKKALSSTTRTVGWEGAVPWRSGEEVGMGTL